MGELHWSGRFFIQTDLVNPEIVLYIYIQIANTFFLNIIYLFCGGGAVVNIRDKPVSYLVAYISGSQLYICILCMNNVNENNTMMKQNSIECVHVEKVP